jgi:hypothetical protein
MVRCHDTSSRSERPKEKGKGKDQLRFGKGEREIDALHCCRARAQRGASSKSSRRFGSLPVIVMRVVNRRSAQREKRPFGTHLASLPYATKQRMWSVNSCSFITPYLYVDDFSRHCVERVKQRNESPWVTVSKCQLSAAPRGILPFLATPASANIKTFTLDREIFQLTIYTMVYCTRNIVGCR